MEGVDNLEVPGHAPLTAAYHTTYHNGPRNDPFIFFDRIRARSTSKLEYPAGQTERSLLGIYFASPLESVFNYSTSMIPVEQSIRVSQTRV